MAGYRDEMVTVSRADGDLIFGEFQFYVVSGESDAWETAQDDVTDLDDDPEAQPVEFVMETWRRVTSVSRTLHPKAAS